MVERSSENAFDYALHEARQPARIQWHFHGRTSLPVAVQSWTLPPGGSEGRHAHVTDQPLEELYVLAPVGSDHDLRNTGPVR